MPRFIERYICECVYHDGHYYDVMVGKVVRAGYSLVQSGKPRPFHFLDGENIAVVAQNGHVFTLFVRTRATALDTVPCIIHSVVVFSSLIGKIYNYTRTAAAGDSRLFIQIISDDIRRCGVCSSLKRVPATDCWLRCGRQCGSHVSRL